MIAFSAFPALRHRDFRLFLAGQVISMAGTWMQSLAQAWLVYRLTHSTVLLGAIGFCTHLPVLLLGPVAGTVCDRYSRRLVVIAAQTGFLLQALTLAALTITGLVTVPLILMLAVVMGVMNAFDIPGRQSLYVHIVGKQDLSNAIVLNSMSFNAARIVGPAIGGFLVAWLGEGPCFLINAASYVAVIASLVMMRPAEPERASGDHPLERLRQGLRYAWTHRKVRALLSVTALANLSNVPAMVLGPVFADAIFGRGSQGLGFLTASLGAGAVVGTFGLARQSRPDKLPAVLSRSTLTAALALIVYALSPSFHVSMAAMSLSGYSIFRFLAAANSLIQSTIQDEYRGRVMSLYSMVVVGMLPVGNLLAGLGGEYLGIRPTVLAGAAMALAAFGLWSRLRDTAAGEMDNASI